MEKNFNPNTSSPENHTKAAEGLGAIMAEINGKASESQTLAVSAGSHPRPLENLSAQSPAALTEKPEEKTLTHATSDRPSDDTAAKTEKAWIGEAEEILESYAGNPYELSERYEALNNQYRETHTPKTNKAA